MNWKAVARLIGVLLAFYSLGFIPSALVSLYYGDGELIHFVTALLASAGLGLLIWFPLRSDSSELRTREGFLVVALFWAVLGMVGAIPFYLGVHLGFTDSVFEAVSGFTTTGATVIVGLDRLPPSILYHRQQLQWFGGMGVVVLAVAILPLLGIGGMQLYRAEASGITKDDKMTPRITHTAQALWALYLALTSSCAIAYWLAGMSVFDAVVHAYSTVATGGFSTHDASLGYFNSVAIEAIATVFMLAGGINFAIHFLAWHRRSLLPYLKDAETHAYAALIAGFSLFVGVSLYFSSYVTNPLQAARYAIFHVASVITSTGFLTQSISHWPNHLPLTLVVLSFIGGCAGSTAGGIKVVRVMLLAKMGLRQMRVLAHPRAVVLIKLGARRVPEQLVYSVGGYYSLYVLTSIVLTVGMMMAGLDLESAIGAVTASINLFGPGLGVVAENFAYVDSPVKWMAVFAMLVGRLEVFTLLILFTPSFWRK